MVHEFPPLPPRNELRFEDGDLVARLPEIDDAQAMFDLLTDSNMPFLLDVDRPESVEQYRHGLELLRASDEAGKPAKTIYWVVELHGETVGLVWEALKLLDKDGGTDGPLLRTAVGVGAYFKSNATSQGLGRRFWALMEDLLVQHFEVEQFIGWMDDDNAMGRAWVAASGGEGPINHSHPKGLGLYRRPTRR